MQRILALAIVAFLIYVVLTQGLPWLKGQLGPESAGQGGRAGGETEHRCVEAAWQANETLAGQIRSFSRPPVDAELWGISFAEVVREIGSAEIECGSCLTEACDKAGTAVAEIRELALQFDDAVRGDPTGWRNPARRQERINRLLNEARTLAGGF